jgi:MoaA/NifB/PqqE/SkfB family radical SAM enzyme
MNCKIWQNKPNTKVADIINEAQLTRLFSGPLFKNCTNIGLAGGEPTISPFFWQLLTMLPKDKQITITTNALKSEKLKSFLSSVEKPENYLIQLSLDGLEEINDRVRGVPGAFKKTIEFLDFLNKHSIRRLISFTISRLNYHELLDCYNLSEKYGAQFSTRMAYCGGAYGNKEEINNFKLSLKEMTVVEHSLQRIINSEIIKPDHSPAHLVFLKHIAKYSSGERKDINCLAMSSGLTIDLWGNVFPNCPAMMKSVGSLHQECLSNIWNADRTKIMRENIAKLKCGGCWNDCQVVTNIQNDTNFLQEEYYKLKKSWIESQRLSKNDIDFTKGNDSFLLDGWYKVEGDGEFRYRWTEPMFSLIVPKGIKRIDISAMFPKPLLKNNSIKLELELQGKLFYQDIEAEEGWRNYTIPLHDMTDEMVRFEIRMFAGYCPKESGDGEDIRTLGMAIGRIRFS